MFRTFTFLFLLISTFSFGQEQRETMYQITNGETNENCGYVNQNGDTLFPIGTFDFCFSDSMDFAIVIRHEDHEPGIPAFDSKGNEIFRVFVYDNGPDYIEDGTFRIIKNGLVGYATEAGKVIVPPMYEAAWPFKNGRALVSFKATKVQDGEHWIWFEEDPFYIDKNGNRHENQEED